MTTYADVNVMDRFGTIEYKDTKEAYTAYTELPAGTQLDKLKRTPMSEFKLWTNGTYEGFFFGSWSLAGVGALLGIILLLCTVPFHVVVWFMIALPIALLISVPIGIVLLSREVKYRRNKPKNVKVGKEVAYDFRSELAFYSHSYGYESVSAYRLTGAKRYAVIAVISGKLLSAIRNNKAWQSEFLDSHRARLDLDVEYNQIVLGCGRLMAVHKKLGDKPTGKSDAEQKAAQIWETQNKRLEAVAKSLEDRLNAMYKYYLNLGDLERQIDTLATLERLSNMDVSVADLEADFMQNQLATENYNDLSEQIEAVQGAMLEVLGIMHSDVSVLSGVGKTAIAA